MKDRTYVTCAGDVPSEPHFAVIESNSRYIEGDQRSRDYPGHGYPATTEQFVQYIAFSSEDALKEYVKSSDKDNHFRVVKVTPMTIRTRVTVDFS